MPKERPAHFLIIKQPPFPASYDRTVYIRRVLDGLAPEHGDVPFRFVVQALPTTPEDLEGMVRQSAADAVFDKTIITSFDDTDGSKGILVWIYTPPPDRGREAISADQTSRRAITEEIAREILAGGGTAYFGGILALRRPDELEALCDDFPLRTSLSDGFSSDNSFQAAVFVARILADYPGYSREYNFSDPGYDWQSLSAKLVRRITSHARSFSGKMAPVYQKHVYDLAIELLQCKPPRNQEALQLLEVSSPGVNQDHQFWVFACNHNIARATRDRSVLLAALSMGTDIIDGKIGVPPSKLKGVQDMVAELRSLEGQAAVQEPPAPAGETARLPAPSTGGARIWGRLASLGALTVTAVVVGVLASRLGREQPRATFTRALAFSGSIERARFGRDGSLVFSGAVMGERRAIYHFQPGWQQPRLVLELSFFGRQAEFIGLSASGEHLLLLASADRPPHVLARVPLLGGAPRELYEDVEEAEWAEDRQGLAMVRRVLGRTRVEFPAGSVVYEPRSRASGLAVSHRGDWLAFREESQGAAAVFVAERGGAARQVAAGGITGRPCWSPSDEELWLSVCESGRCRLDAVTPSGDRRTLTSIDGELQLQDVASDGRALFKGDISASGRAELHMASGLTP